MMHYSFQPRDQIFKKGYGFLSFAKSIGKKKNGKNINKNLRCKYSQKLDHAKQSATDAFKTASKRAIPKAAEATGDETAVKILKF